MRQPGRGECTEGGSCVTGTGAQGKLRRNVVVLSRRSRDGGMESGVHIRGVNPDTGNSDNTMKADNPAMRFTGGLWKWEP